MFNSKRKTISRTNSYGVARIKRANYSTTLGMNTKAGWWAIQKEVMERDGGLCVPHKRRGVVVKATEVHHIKSLSAGGTNAKSNLMAVCDFCHKARHNHLR